MKTAALLQDKILPLIFRLALGGVFIFAAVPKIIAPEKFAQAISNYRMLPNEWLNLLAITLPWVELLAGILLVVGAWVRASAWAVTGMCVMFLVAISSAVSRGLNIDCGCFGTVSGRRIGLASLAFDIALLGMAVWLSWCERDAGFCFWRQEPSSQELAPTSTREKPA
jgi:uncharacterized membrane protein YphA (DoxX/SURF4 family)